MPTILFMGSFGNQIFDEDLNCLLDPFILVTSSGTYANLTLRVLVYDKRNVASNRPIPRILPNDQPWRVVLVSSNSYRVIDVVSERVYKDWRSKLLWVSEDVVLDVMVRFPANEALPDVVKAAHEGQEWFHALVS